MASTILELPEFKQYSPAYNARHTKLTRLRRYYDGTIYDDTPFVLAAKLYAKTRGLFAFLARAVDLDVALIPGVMQPWALQLGTPPAISEAQALLYDWSNWPIRGDDWLEDGTTCGEAFVKIVPTANGTIEMQRLKPEITMLIEQHSTDGQMAPLGLIIDRGAGADMGKRYEYGEAITPAEIRTYRNGDPFGYNGLPDRYPNPLGFVPIVQTKNDTERRPTFAKARRQIDSVNELASYLNDIIGKHGEPQWAMMGAEPSELVKSGDNVWHLPQDASLEAILASIDIPGTLSFIQEVKEETKANLPELAFDDLRQQNQIATETLIIQLMELDVKIWKMRRRYDDSLIRAHRMAAQAGVVIGITGLAPLLAPHGFDYKRAVRPISRLEEIRIREAELALELQEALAAGEGITTIAEGLESVTAGVATEFGRAVLN